MKYEAPKQTLFHPPFALSNLNQVDLDKALLYLLRVVEPVAGGEYVVVYFHTKTQRDNIPSYWWIKQIYNTLPYKYKKNLKVNMSSILAYVHG